MSLLYTRQEENFIISVDFNIPFDKTSHGKREENIWNFNKQLLYVCIKFIFTDKGSLKWINISITNNV